MKEKRRKGKNQYSPESKRKLGYTGNAYIETEKDREGLDTRARGEKDDICCSLDTTFTFHPLLTILPPSSFSGNTLPLILTAPVSKHYWTMTSINNQTTTPIFVKAFSHPKTFMH